MKLVLAEKLSVAQSIAKVLGANKREDGYLDLRSGTEYDALYEAALCRERADWIVGINATRLFSTLYGQTLNVGRVMTPTLAMAVMREAAIAAFKQEPFYKKLNWDISGLWIRKKEEKYWKSQDWIRMSLIFRKEY